MTGDRQDSLRLALGHEAGETPPMLDVVGSPWCPRRDLLSSAITDEEPEDTRFEDGLPWSLQLQVGLTLRLMPSPHPPCLWRLAGLQGEGCRDGCGPWNPWEGIPPEARLQGDP